MAWVEVHQSLREHRKLYSCADDLDIEPVLLLGMLVSLWLWALDNTPDGGLDNISNRTIARATRWPEKKADQLMTALINNGWIDRTEGGGLALHDWSEYGGKLTERRATDRARKAARMRKGERIPAEFQRKKIGVETEIRRYTTQHYRTPQNRTLQNTRLQYLLTELLEGTHVGLTARRHRLLTIRPSRLCTMPPAHRYRSVKSCQMPGKVPSGPECGWGTRRMTSDPVHEGRSQCLFAGGE